MTSAVVVVRLLRLRSSLIKLSLVAIACAIYTPPTSDMLLSEMFNTFKQVLAAIALAIEAVAKSPH